MPPSEEEAAAEKATKKGAESRAQGSEKQDAQGRYGLHDEAGGWGLPSGRAQHQGEDRSVQDPHPQRRFESLKIIQKKQGGGQT